MRLIADLGGTNCRVAMLREPGRAPSAVHSFANRNFTSFSAVVQSYLARVDAPAPQEIVAAVAGPVSCTATGQIAQVTNRNWLISARALSQEFGGIPVHLLNDLSALGHSLPGLKGPDLAEILPPQDISPQVQNLVIGIGTGFNLSPALTTPQGVSCLAAEYGHVALPLDLYQALQDRIGDRAAQFRSVECCFSGRGFARLHAACCPDCPPLDAEDIMRRAREGDYEPSQFTAFYARLLALLSRNLLKGFLPRGGLYFAGTVARNLLTSHAQNAFVTEFSRPDPQFPEITAPVFCILDDAAALKGCAGFSFAAP
ncbi:glucokinase [Pseudophaeobacter sp.]|uniref:glucokinase n=1 Tax=Pseudophaeobacter sp. TaxID=1971739 RepID=UPI00405819EB